MESLHRKTIKISHHFNVEVEQEDVVVYLVFVIQRIYSHCYSNTIKESVRKKGERERERGEKNMSKKVDFFFA